MFEILQILQIYLLADSHGQDQIGSIYSTREGQMVCVFTIDRFRACVKSENLTPRFFFRQDN